MLLARGAWPHTGPRAAPEFHPTLIGTVRDARAERFEHTQSAPQ